MNDVIGHRCIHHDPIVEARLFGGPSDYFVLIIETVVREGGQVRIDRRIIPKAPAKHITLKLNLGETK